MYCVIKCVKNKRVLKGNFASSVFHSCTQKRQKRKFASLVRNVLTYFQMYHNRYERPTECLGPQRCSQNTICRLLNLKAKDRVSELSLLILHIHNKTHHGCSHIFETLYRSVATNIRISSHTNNEQRTMTSTITCLQLIKKPRTKWITGNPHYTRSHFTRFCYNAIQGKSREKIVQ
jgi:hypothetical protein